MQILTKETDYAVRALIRIAGEPGRSATASVIAEGEQIPWLFLRRVMQKLAAAGVLASQRGRRGGFRLARPASRISLADVVRISRARLNSASVW